MGLQVTCKTIWRCLLLAGCASAVQSRTWTLSDIPNPSVNPNLCGREKTSWVCDPDRVLTFDSANYIEGTLRDIAQGKKPYARDYCGRAGLVGYQVAIVVVRDMSVAGAYDAEQEAQAFAKGVHDSWGVGDAECNNGVVILLAINVRQVYISTGSGANRKLGSSTIKKIINGMRPHLRSGDYARAMEQAVVDVGLGLSGMQPKYREDGWGGTAVFMLFAGVFGFLTFKSWRAGSARRQELSRVKRMLDRLRQQQENCSRSPQTFQVDSCPVCLDDFQPTPEGAVATDGQGTSSGHGKANLRAGFADNAASTSTSTTGVVEVEKEALLGGKQASGNEHAGSSAAQGSARAPEAEHATAHHRASLTLPCGHKFCEPCIERWLQQNNSCPICRRPIDHDPRATQPPPPSQSATYMQGNPVADMWPLELTYRLNSMHRMYPHYVTTGMVNDWTREAQVTGSFNWQSHHDFQLHDAPLRQERTHAGRTYGANSSFGGGSSTGGGGGGGSW